MEIPEIRDHLKKAAIALFYNQPNIFEFTSETGQTEWNLAHHLANEIHKEFSEMDCDLDVVKANLGDRRPDIIFHKRGTNEFNFLVIEVKREGQPADIKADKGKIRLYWFGKKLHYQFGAIVNINRDKTYQIDVIKNETHQ